MAWGMDDGEPLLAPAAIQQLVDHVYEGHRSAKCVPPLEDSFAHSIDMASAYAVHWGIVGRKLEDPSLYRRGFKIGMTRRRAGTFNPVYGVLLSNNVVTPGESIPGMCLRQPYPEAEVGLVVREPIDPTMDAGTIVGHCDVVLTVEITDCRYCYDDWPAQITDSTLVCDQTACARLVVGTSIARSEQLDSVLAEEQELWIDGELVEWVTQRDNVLHPTDAIGWLVGALGRRGEHLEIGDVVSTGRRSRVVRRVGRGNTIELVSPLLGTVTVHVS